MSWQVKYNQELHIIELVYREAITARDLQQATSKCIALGKEKGTNKFLCDALEAEFSATLMDIYDLPEKQYVAENADRSGCVAVVLHFRVTNAAG